MRKDPIVNGGVYHIFSRSIAEYRIFNDTRDFLRMLELIKYYTVNDLVRFSDFIATRFVEKNGFHNAFKIISKEHRKIVQVIAYCIMPTHLHLIIKQLSDEGVSEYTRKIFDSYTRYFNTKHQRKGPLWESKYKSVLCKTDEQLIHLTRYLHLNPVTARLVDRPQDWENSSYFEYLSKVDDIRLICQFNDLIDIRPLSYQKFVNNQISYQRELAKIKKLVLE